MRRDLPSGTVTFLFTDIEGSTRLLEALGEHYGEALEAQRRLLRHAFADAGGVEVDTQGDAFFVVFPAAGDAVRAAAQAQRGLAEHEWPESLPVRVRMGLHTGEPGGSPRATSGWTCISVPGSVRRPTVGRCSCPERRASCVGDVPGDGLTLLDLGSHRLKDLTLAQKLYQLEIEGLREPRSRRSGRSRTGPTNLPYAADAADRPRGRARGGDRLLRATRTSDC